MPTREFGNLRRYTNRSSGADNDIFLRQKPPDAMSESKPDTKPSANLAIRLGLRIIADIASVTNHARKHAMTVVKCLTPAMGTHPVKCRCGEVMAEPNACRQRFCPLCCGPRLTRFLFAWSKRFLLVDHFHLVFTLPHEVNLLWMLNPAKMGDILFKAVSITIKTLMADPQWCGAQPGFVCFLQTWSNELKHHPHLHVILTAGGVGLNGIWIAMRRGEDFAIPHEVISDMFQKVFTRLLKDAMEEDDDDFRIPSYWNPRKVRKFLKALDKKAFVVWITGAYASPMGILRYLAQYAVAGPVPNSKMVAVNKKTVTFLMQPRPDLAELKKTLTLEEFLERYLQHIPPQGFHIVRGYGLYSATCKLKATDLPEQPVATDERPMMPMIFQEDLPIDEPYRCPACRAVFATAKTMRIHRRGGYRRVIAKKPTDRAGPLASVA